uniref:Uncharacterized protein n=1 Tax=Anopheles christyi TaxID=43041 RepID=A0A182K1G4_9DIPT
MDLEQANDAIKPGDDVARSKAELDFEDHILDTKVRLSDGTDACVFSRTPRNKDLLFGYMCHICGVACLYGERMLQIHIAGRKHQARLNVTVFDAEQYRASLVAKPTKANDSNNSSGGGGQENDASSSSSMKPQARLQNVLDGYRDGPLVGLEYIVELTDSANGADPIYSCLLCNLNNNNESGITTHMIGLGHRFKFLEKHYPTVRKMLAPYRNHNQENGGQVFFRVVQTVCEAIEDHHGRLTPQVYEATDFERNRVKFGQQIAFGTHFDERTGPKFVEVIDAKVLQDLITAEDCGGGQVQGAPKRYRPRNERRSSLDSISSVSSANSMLTISSASEHEDRGRQRQRSPLNGQGSRQGGRGEATYQRQPRPTPVAANAASKQMIPTPRELSIQSAAIAHERYKWEKYRCSVDIAVTQLTKQLKDYEKNPEKHPLYSEEWKKFWNRRYKELQAEKKDPSKHNFKPEWIEFWTKRMKELHDEEVARKKEEIRSKMNLPPEDEERTGELREQFALRVPSAGKRARSSDRKTGTAAAPILIDVNTDEDEDDYKGGQPMRSRNRSSPRPSRRSEWPESRTQRSTSRSHRSRSPISDDNGYDGGYSRSRSHRAPPPKDYRAEWDGGKHRAGPAQERVDYDEWAKNYYGPNKKVFVRTEFDADNATPLNFVAVCRLLTAFEEYLGSLGPKVIDLLAKALALEKVKANSADDLLLNEDNCMFLETVKEKLKGHMMAETIDPNRMVPIKKAVCNIARLVHEASKREPVKPPEEEASRDSVAMSGAAAPLTAAAAVPACGTSTDKIAVAEQLAKSLVAQGKTDFTTEELEQLINVYVTMAQMSREQNTLVTAKEYMATISPSAVPVPPKEVVPAAIPTAVVASKLSERVRPEATGTGGGAARWNSKTMDIPVRSGKTAGKANIDDEEPILGLPENLTDSDLQTLLQSFKDLSNDEQMHLISYLRKMEHTEPERVERLRRYVNFDAWNNPASGGNDGGRRDVNSRLSDEDERSYLGQEEDSNFDMFRPSGPTTGGRKPVQNPLSKNSGQQRAPLQRAHQEQQQQRQKEMQPQQQKPLQQKVNPMLMDSEDEDDYSYDDILRAASKNVSSVQQSSKTPSDAYDGSSNHSPRTSGHNETGSGANSSAAISLSDKQNLIANLMESLQKSVSDANSHTSGGTGNSGGTTSYANPITTIGGTGGKEGTIGKNVPIKVTPATPNASSMFQSFPQQQPGMGMSFGGQQGQMPMGQMPGPQGQMPGPQGQMQLQFGNPYMYQGQQMFGANGPGPQQMQQYGGYGNYGYY